MPYVPQSQDTLTKLYTTAFEQKSFVFHRPERHWRAFPFLFTSILAGLVWFVYPPNLLASSNDGIILSPHQYAWSNNSGSTVPQPYRRIRALQRILTMTNGRACSAIKNWPRHYSAACDTSAKPSVSTDLPCASPKG